MNGITHREDGILQVRMPINEWEFRHTGRQTEGFTVRGYAAVYGQTSLDLGGFREVIADGAFDEVLSSDPDVHFVWDHDTRYVGARTANGTLKLWSDGIGLGIEAQVGNYSWAKDLRIGLERGDIDQGSFSFNVAKDGDEWALDDEENVLRTVRNVGNLYDVTVTAKGAYPQTSMAALRSLIEAAGQEVPEGLRETVPVDGEGGSESQEGSEEPEPKPEVKALMAKAELRRQELAQLRERMERL